MRDGLRFTHLESTRGGASADPDAWLLFGKRGSYTIVTTSIAVLADFLLTAGHRHLFRLADVFRTGHGRLPCDFRGSKTSALLPECRSWISGRYLAGLEHREPQRERTKMPTFGGSGLPSLIAGLLYSLSHHVDDAFIFHVDQLSAAHRAIRTDRTDYAVCRSGPGRQFAGPRGHRRLTEGSRIPFRDLAQRRPHRIGGFCRGHRFILCANGAPIDLNSASLVTPGPEDIRNR